ncbi:Meiotically up-regulated gene 180 protein, partial [Termitomyces sp. J132]
IVLLLRAVQTTFIACPKVRKSWRRFLWDTAFRSVADVWNIKQFQFVFGTSLHIYEVWARSHGFPVLVDDIGTHGGRLLWIGPRNTKRVVLYLHGGGYIIPLQDFSVTFWNYIRLKLEEEGTSAGFAIMSYSIIPTVEFPTQFVQAVEALQHIIASGCSPQNIHIVGDSAGGNLALALLSHMLHPIENVPPISLASRIGGIFLMSPWVSLTGDTGSHLVNDSFDIVGTKTFAYCGRKVLEDVPDSLRMYLEISKAPDTWFKGIDKLVSRILITAGGVECLRDDIVQVSHELSKNHSEVRLIVQENGVHNDPFYDFLAGERHLGDLTPKILVWLCQGLKGSKEED